MKRTTELTTATVALVGLVGAGALWVFSEKDIPHSTNEDWITGHYRGLGQDVESTGLIGYMWTGVTLRFEDGGYWRMDFEEPGFNPFVGYYPDGSVREVGTCMVEMVNSGPVMPSPDFHHVDSSQCYRPDGTLGSEVIDGTGIQTVWSPGGIKLWELHLENHVRTLRRSWHDNGQLQTEQRYEQGGVHGPFTHYYPDGQVQMTGEYDRGERVGVWTRYFEDGTVMSVDDYTTPDAG